MTPKVVMFNMAVGESPKAESQDGESENKLEEMIRELGGKWSCLLYWNKSTSINSWTKWALSWEEEINPHECYLPLQCGNADCLKRLFVLNIVPQNHWCSIISRQILSLRVSACPRCLCKAMIASQAVCKVHPHSPNKGWPTKKENAASIEKVRVLNIVQVWHLMFRIEMVSSRYTTHVWTPKRLWVQRPELDAFTKSYIHQFIPNRCTGSKRCVVFFKCYKTNISR